jgi:hypothetical protein
VRFRVKRYWELCDEVEVEADDGAKAIEAAHALPLAAAKAHYVPDSLNSDPDADVYPLSGGVR